MSGVFVLTAACPPIDSVVHAEVAFPRSDGDSKVEMKSEMRVMRVESDMANDRRSGFSAVGKGFALRAIPKQGSQSATDPAKETQGAE